MNTRLYFVIFFTSIFLSCAASPLDSWVEIDRPSNTGALITVDFGNGVFQNSTSGSLTYKYPVAGTYTVKVTAKSQSGKRKNIIPAYSKNQNANSKASHTR